MRFELTLKHLSLENFRLFDKLEVPFHPKLTVLIGENGAGKTALLEAVAKALNVYVSTMRNNTQEFDPCNYIKDNDVLFNKNELRVSLNLFLNSDMTYGERKTSTEKRAEKEAIEKEIRAEKEAIEKEYESKRRTLEIQKNISENNTNIVFSLKFAVDALEIPNLDEKTDEDKKATEQLKNIEEDPEYIQYIENIEADYHQKLEKLEEEKLEKLEIIDNSDKQIIALEGDLDFAFNYNKKDLKNSRLSEDYDYTKLNQLTFTYDENLKKDIAESVALPIVVFYNINRLNFDFQEIAKREYTALSAYDNALDGLELDYNLFFRWYKWQKDTDIFKKTNVIQHIDKAILSVMNDGENQVFSDLIIEPTTDIREYRLVLKKGNIEVEADQLSSGEKSMLILIADIARRLCLLNPKSDNPLHGQGIVLIDEIDLHLHPKWQAVVVEKLQAIFPNVQWVMTTHSPKVVSSLERENILILNNGQIADYKPFVKGRDTNSIMSDVFHVPKRLTEYENKLSQIYRHIDKGEREKAEENLSYLKQFWGEDDVEIHRAESFLELI